MVLLEEAEAAPAAEVAAPVAVAEAEVEVKRVGTMNHFSPGTVNQIHLFLLYAQLFFPLFNMCPIIFLSLSVSHYTTPNLCLSLCQKFELKSVNI